ncbi:MAG: nitroreductase family protein [Candidatus Bathyarchaeia archaeon]
MNETIKVIKNRRSIRKFKPGPIPEEYLKEILECAILAPNARNQQKWHFTVIQNKEIIAKMTSILRENLLKSGIDFLVERVKDPNFNPFGGAPVVILITADKSARFVEFDCAAAAENIMIAAESLGLGSHVMAMTEFIFMSDEGRDLKKELGVPEGYEHICTVALGYKDESPPPKPRRKDVINFVK